MAAALSRMDLSPFGVSADNGPAVRKLSVTAFRNYKNLRLELSRKPIVLTGHNGAGKTNLMEALSFLSPGTGLRKARLSNIDMVSAKNEDQLAEITDGTQRYWAVSVDLELENEKLVIGTGRDERAAASGSDKRIVRINGQQAKSHSVLLEYLTLSWITPQMDRLFLDGLSQRRRFLDRLVYAFDPKHAGRVSAYTYAIRERNRLIKSGNTDDAWYLALENKIAETGVAIVAARRELVNRLGPIASLSLGPFPGAILKLVGDIECWLSNAAALEVEDRYKRELIEARKSRNREPFSIPGPHKTDLFVSHSIKNIPASQCSTGEQKALLIAIILSHARLRKIEFGHSPLMLLDEVTAHLDSQRRDMLFDILESLDSQVWMTGTEVSLFTSIQTRAQFFEISNGEVRKNESFSI
ncbi:MAG: DNA replication/repair protein RecF [Thalassobaculaceae bacterium]